MNRPIEKSSIYATKSLTAEEIDHYQYVALKMRSQVSRAMAEKITRFISKKTCALSDGIITGFKRATIRDLDASI